MWLWILLVPWFWVVVVGACLLAAGTDWQTSYVHQSILSSQKYKTQYYQATDRHVTTTLVQDQTKILFPKSCTDVKSLPSGQQRH